jgi:hypothetical protein
MATRWGAAAGALVSAIVLAGCQGTGGSPGSAPSAGTGTGTATATADGRCEADDIGAVDAGSVLVAGPGNGVPPSTATGDRLVLVGVVLDTGCRPAAEASIDVWHTDARGVYGPTDGECCYYRGTVRTDLNGRFRLDTVRPGRYAGANAPPAHIHMDIRHRSGGLMTELVFVGDPGVPPTAVEGLTPVALHRVAGATQSWYGEAVLVLAE